LRILLSSPVILILINNNISSTTSPQKIDSQKWETDEKKSSLNSVKNNKWTNRSHDVIEEEKVVESVSNSKSSIHTKGERIYPLSVDNKTTFENRQIFCNNYLMVSQWELKINGFSDFQVALAMTMRSPCFEIGK
jgi:hypothetical protein